MIEYSAPEVNAMMHSPILLLSRSRLARRRDGG